jgi:FAD/FMN-containing dehydrogenase
MFDLELKGRVIVDDKSLSRYAYDMNGYFVKPQLVVAPKDEEDILEILALAKRENLPITPRGANSNQAGSAVGEGILILFEDMKSILKEEAGLVEVQPGIVFADLDSYLNEKGYFLPYNPSSRNFCTIGGNVATGSSGIRTIKYGSVDHWLKSVRLILPEYGIVDTKEELPPELAKKILAMKKRIRKDSEVIKILDRRKELKSSFGYNIRAFFDHDSAEDILTHLVVGSVGSLGIFTSITLGSQKLPEKRVLYLVAFPDIITATKEAQDLTQFNPSSMEFMDSFGLQALKEEHMIDVSEDFRTIIIMELDEHLEEAESKLEKYFQQKNIKAFKFSESEKQKAIWSIRESILLRIKKEKEKGSVRVLSFVDDLGVPMDKLPEFMAEILDYFQRKDITLITYGHAGEGNIHMGPLMDTRLWRLEATQIASDTFRTALKYNGTIAAEHGNGRNRSKYLQQEWGYHIYQYFQKIKKILDPNDLLNSHVMFSEKDLVENLRY